MKRRRTITSQRSMAGSNSLRKSPLPTARPRCTPAYMRQRPKYRLTKPMLAKMSKNTPKNVRPENASSNNNTLVATNTASTSLAGSPRKNAKLDSSTSTAASAYFTQVGGIQIPLLLTSASVASPSTSTPGITASVGVGLVSLMP